MGIINPSTHPWWRRLSARQFITALLMGALVVIGVGIVTCISLAPAHISFSITNATTSVIPVEGNPRLVNGYYNLTLVANNPSRRTSVRYSSLSAQIWYSATGWIPSEEVNTTAALLPERWQRPRSSAAFAVWAEYGQYDEAGNVTSNGTTAGGGSSSQQLDAAEKGSDEDYRVVVQARVWFRPGIRPYTVTVTCDHVNFVNNGTTGFPVQCCW